MAALCFLDSWCATGSTCSFFWNSAVFRLVDYFCLYWLELMYVIFIPYIYYSSCWVYIWNSLAAARQNKLSYFRITIWFCHTCVTNYKVSLMKDYLEWFTFFFPKRRKKNILKEKSRQENKKNNCLHWWYLRLFVTKFQSTV